MYNKQEKKVLDLLRQVEVAYTDLVFPQTTTSGKKHHASSSRRNDGVVQDKDIYAFREGIAQLERNLKARAADRLNDLDLSDYVKQFITEQHPHAEGIDFKVTFTNKEIIRQELEITPSEYGVGLITKAGKRQIDEGQCLTKASDDNDDDDDE